MSITEYFGQVLGVAHTKPNCTVCEVTTKNVVRTSTKTWSKR